MTYKPQYNLSAQLALALTAIVLPQSYRSSAEERTHTNFQEVFGNPSIETCPTANCPIPPSQLVLSTQVIHGVSTKGSQQPEWLSNLGLFVRTGSPNGQKVTQYLGVMQQEGAGTAWTLNTNLVRNAGLGGENAIAGFEGSGKPGRPGAVGDRNGSIGYELDFTNWDADSSPGKGAFTVGQYIHAQGTYTSLSAIYLDAKMASERNSSGWTDGILFNGDRVVSDNTLVDASHSINSLYVSGVHSTGLNTYSANSDLHAVVMKSGQTLCLNGVVECFAWQAGRLTYTNDQGKQIFSIDENGNAFFKGHVFSRQ